MKSLPSVILLLLLVLPTSAVGAQGVDRVEYSRALQALRGQLVAIKGLEGEYDHDYTFPFNPELEGVKLRARFQLDGNLLTSIYEQRRRITTLQSPGIAKQDALFDGVYQWRKKEDLVLIRSVRSDIPGIFPTELLMPFAIDKLPSTPQSVERLLQGCEIEGNLTHITLGPKNGLRAHEIWFDRKTGWPRRWVSRLPNGTAKTAEVEQFLHKTVDNRDVYYPQKITVTCTLADGSQALANTLVVDPQSFVFNPVFTKETFAMTPEFGDLIFDEDTNDFVDPLDVRPMADAEGNRIDDVAPPAAGWSVGAAAPWGMVTAGVLAVIAGIWMRRGHAA